MPEITPVDSSVLEAIGYEDETRELYVYFRSGKRYVYSGVEERVFLEFQEAESKGQYLNAHIKPYYEVAEL